MGGESLISSLPQPFPDMGILGLWIRPISVSLNNNKGIILLGGVGGGGRSGLCRRLSGTHMLGRWLISAVELRPAICLVPRLLGCRLTGCPRSRPALSLLGIRKEIADGAYSTEEGGETGGCLCKSITSGLLSSMNKNVLYVRSYQHILFYSCQLI